MSLHQAHVRHRVLIELKTSGIFPDDTVTKAPLAGGADVRSFYYNILLHSVCHVCWPYFKQGANPYSYQ